MQSKPGTATKRHKRKLKFYIIQTRKWFTTNTGNESPSLISIHYFREKKTLFIMAVRSISVNQYLSHYCNSLYVSVSQSSVSQNAAAWLLTRTQKKEHITHDLASQQWPAFHFRVHYKIIFFVLKCINGVAPSYLFELLHFHSPFQLLRSADQLWMCQADRAFAV